MFVNQPVSVLWTRKSLHLWFEGGSELVQKGCYGGIRQSHPQAEGVQSYELDLLLQVQAMGQEQGQQMQVFGGPVEGVNAYGQEQDSSSAPYDPLINLPGTGDFTVSYTHLTLPTIYSV